MTVWLNGAIVDPDTAFIASNDRGFLLGDGLFETMLARGSVIVEFRAHMERLRASAGQLEIPIPYSDSQIAEAVNDLISADRLQGGRASLRFTLSRGRGPRGLLFPRTPHPTCMMTVTSATEPPQHMTAIISQIRRNEFSPLSRMKTLNYLDSVLARREADLAGADEAIMLNTKDKVACASTANLFVVEEDRIATPPIEDGVLPGTTRTAVIRLAEAHNILCTEETISYDRFMQADAVFITNSLIGICPINKLETKAIKAHSKIERLQTLYDDYLDRLTD